jgi:hypothetical protein
MREKSAQFAQKRKDATATHLETTQVINWRIKSLLVSNYKRHLHSLCRIDRHLRYYGDWFSLAILHGAGGTATELMNYFLSLAQWELLAEQNNFFFNYQHRRQSQMNCDKRFSSVSLDHVSETLDNLLHRKRDDFVTVLST